MIYSVSDMVKSSKKLNNAFFFAAKKSNITAVVSNFFVVVSCQTLYNSFLKCGTHKSVIKTVNFNSEIIN